MFALLVAILTASPTYADHKSRDRALGETGLDVILVSLVLAAAFADASVMPKCLVRTSTWLRS